MEKWVSLCVYFYVYLLFDNGIYKECWSFIIMWWFKKSCDYKENLKLK